MLYNVHTCSSLWGRSFKWNPLNPGPSPTSQPSLCSGNQLSDCWCEIFDTWHTGNRKHKFQAVNLVNFIYSVSTQSLAQFWGTPLRLSPHVSTKENFKTSPSRLSLAVQKYSAISLQTSPTRGKQQPTGLDHWKGMWKTHHPGEKMPNLLWNCHPKSAKRKFTPNTAASNRRKPGLLPTPQIQGW